MANNNLLAKQVNGKLLVVFLHKILSGNVWNVKTKVRKKRICYHNRKILDKLFYQNKRNDKSENNALKYFFFLIKTVRE